MKQNIMKKWVKALRSGKFKQGFGTLKQYNSRGTTQHCCLGVLCELYNEEMKKNKKKSLTEKVFYNDSNYSDGYFRFDGKKEDLPKSVVRWAGMISTIGQFFTEETWFGNYKVENTKECLADLNDTGKKFKTIANIIEKNWENL